MHRELRVGRGITMIEVLIALAIFSLVFTGCLELFRWNLVLMARAEMLDRALLVAQDLHEEMVAAAARQSGPDPAAPTRPAKFGSAEAYIGFVDSPVHDIHGRKVKWASDLMRRVKSASLADGSRSGDAAIEVRNIRTDEALIDARFTIPSITLQ